MIWKTTLAIIIGYLSGSINSSIIMGTLHGVDIREHGSGNAGMTNTLRTLGKKAALLVLAGDILKGVLACLAGYFLAGGRGLAAGGLAAVLGHNWPVYFGFKGGKGALTSITVVFLIDWRAGLILIGIFLAVTALTRYVSLGSMAGAAAAPFITMLLGRENFMVAAAALLGILAIARHHSNISRLLKGTESKLGRKKR